MVYDAHHGGDVLLLWVVAITGCTATHEIMNVARRFQEKMETVHTLATVIGKGYKRSVAHLLPPEDTAAHQWARNRTDSFPMFMIEGYFYQK